MCHLREAIRFRQEQLGASGMGVVRNSHVQVLILSVGNKIGEARQCCYGQVKYWVNGKEYGNCFQNRAVKNKKSV